MEDIVDPPIIKERNIFTVVVNKNNDLLVEEKPMPISDLREAARKWKRKMQPIRAWTAAQINANIDAWLKSVEARPTDSNYTSFDSYLDFISCIGWFF